MSIKDIDEVHEPDDSSGSSGDLDQPVYMCSEKRGRAGYGDGFEDGRSAYEYELSGEQRKGAHE